jgi:hypothetical protein
VVLFTSADGLTAFAAGDGTQLWTGPRISGPGISHPPDLFIADDLVCCLDAESGAFQWTFTAGARVDSPPTLHHGLVLFGCRDGWVCCLRAADGVTCWRFRAAPEDRHILAFDQLESPWPVPGSVLVLDGVAYVAAGWSSFLDSGVHLYGLKPQTGEVLYHTCVEGPWPDVHNEVGRPFAPQKRGHSTFPNKPPTDRVAGNEKVECPYFPLRPRTRWSDVVSVCVTGLSSLAGLTSLQCGVVMMAGTSVESRLDNLESQVLRLQEELRSIRRENRDWRRTIGAFTDDDGMQELLKEAMRLREADREDTRPQTDGDCES